MFPSFPFVSLTVVNCQNGVCITLDKLITAQAGLCVVIQCSFTTRDALHLGSLFGTNVSCLEKDVPIQT